MTLSSSNSLSRFAVANEHGTMNRTSFTGEFDVGDKEVEWDNFELDNIELGLYTEVGDICLGWLFLDFWDKLRKFSENKAPLLLELL